MKKILFATHSPYYIGGEKSMLDVLKGIKSYFNVALLVPEGELYEIAKKEGIKVYKLPFKDSLIWKTKRKFLLPLFKSEIPKILEGLNKIVKDYNPDIIYTHSMKMHLFFSLFFLKNKKKLVWHFRDIPEESSKFIFKFFSIFPNRIIAISEGVKRFFPIKSKIRVVYNGIKIPEKIEENNNIKKKRFTILSVGNIQYWKAQDLIIECAKRLKNFDFWIIGDAIHPGEKKFKDKIIKKIKEEKIENVILWGKRDDVFSFYKECDVFLHIPRAREGFGRVIVEAMAMKKPVIVSNVAALPEIVNDAGFLVRNGDLDDICSKILLYYNDENLRKEMGERGFIRYKNLFTPEKMIEGVLKCLKEII
ncbi:MAG: glycosyltransferase family 4 protein [candidate division WOR-3 bacterium]